MWIAQNFEKQTLKYLTTVLLSDKWPGILRILSFTLISTMNVLQYQTIILNTVNRKVKVKSRELPKTQNET